MERSENKKAGKENKLKKLWGFLWEENSLLSWAVFFIVVLPICFLIIKFVFFPFFSFVFSSPLPFVIVESGSMEHNNANFDKWWNSSGGWYEANNITKEKFLEWPWRKGFNKGDIMVVAGSKEYNQGDVIVFKRDAGVPIIHRLIFLEPLGTKGDNNLYQLGEEKNIGKDRVLGKAVFKIPLLGYLKLVFVEIYNNIK